LQAALNGSRFSERRGFGPAQGAGGDSLKGDGLQRAAASSSAMHNLILATRNETDFPPSRGLRIENWWT